jgi:TolB-like protein/class 3 adenylate cyclase
MQHHRQLAAILFTDIVGYTSLMQRDEQGAVEAIKKHRMILESQVKNHQGEIIEYFGDGSLCIFSSATEAVRCAMQIQNEMKAEPVIPLRIGIHIGEIFFEDKRVMGDGVNLASRIQSLGEAGSVLFSKEIADKIRNHQEFKTESLGFFGLKNVDEPMEIFALSNPGITVPKKEKMSSRMPLGEAKIKHGNAYKWIGALLVIIVAIIVWYYNRTTAMRAFTGKDKSIAVLPFSNISNDSLQNYFSDGITEEIITQLSKIADLKVISRTSVMQYKNTQKNIRQIAKELGVSTVLEGSVRRDGNTVRITAQLIDAGTDKHIWSEKYDGNANEIFAIQTNVAQEIAREMNATLTVEESKRLGKKPTASVAAYEEYLKANQVPFSQAEGLLLSALKKDSTFAPAWARLAYVYSKMGNFRPLDAPSYIRKSLNAALTAIEYGPELSESHMIFGDILKTITLNPALSIKELQKSISLNPSNAEAYAFLAYALIELGQFQESELNLVKAEQLAPQSALIRGAWIRFYIYSRNANQLLLVGKGISPPLNVNMEKSIKVQYFFLQDKYDSMLVYALQLHNPGLSGLAYAKLGNTSKAGKIIDSLKQKSENDNCFDIGIIYAWLGEKQKAIDYLNLAYRLYNYELISIKVNKLFDPLRNEEGFQDLLKKMGMF